MQSKCRIQSKKSRMSKAAGQRNPDQDCDREASNKKKMAKAVTEGWPEPETISQDEKVDYIYNFISELIR